MSKRRYPAPAAAGRKSGAARRSLTERRDAHIMARHIALTLEATAEGGDNKTHKIIPRIRQELAEGSADSVRWIWGRVERVRTSPLMVQLMLLCLRDAFEKACRATAARKLRSLTKAEETRIWNRASKTFPRTKVARLLTDQQIRNIVARMSPEKSKRTGRSTG